MRCHPRPPSGVALMLVEQYVTWTAGEFSVKKVMSPRGKVGFRNATHGVRPAVITRPCLKNNNLTEFQWTWKRIVNPWHSPTGISSAPWRLPLSNCRRNHHRQEHPRHPRRHRIRTRFNHQDSVGMPVGPSRRTHHFSINNLVRESTRTDFFTIGEPVAPITIQLFSLVLSMPTSTIDAGSTVRDENGKGGQTHWCPNRRHCGKQKNVCPTPNLGIVMQLEGLTSPNACRRN